MNLNPSNQLNLFGHHTEFQKFSNLFLNRKLPNKILLSGEKGIGKSTLAYHIVNYVLSDDEDFSYDIKNFPIESKNKIILIDPLLRKEFYSIKQNENLTIDVLI